MDFGSMNQKFMSSLITVADRPTTSTLLSISYSDDDYQTFSTPRTMELNQEYPILHQLGRFRRRAVKLSYSGSNRIRLHRLEVSYNIGLN